MNKLEGFESNIPGLWVIHKELHGDERGWFQENYQEEKLRKLGLPVLQIVQNNFSFNAERGVTRGLHAEPWEKYITVANGRVFGAWVDLRAGDSFGEVFTTEITPEIAIFVPRGVANGYQTLEPKVAYTYLVNGHWSPDTKYTFVNLFDPSLGIKWPIPQDQALTSAKDSAHPSLEQVTPMELM